jgi:dienelactone hydrolase/uncharacterized lipoprotein YbaY
VHVNYGAIRLVLACCLLGVLLSACATPSAPTPTTAPPAPSPTPLPTTAAVPTITPSTPPTAPSARQYALGQTDISVQIGAAGVEPLELRGTLAAPDQPGPHPVVLVLHGSHAVCPMQPQSPEEPETCPQDTQFRNDVGFGYLLEVLAANGMIAIAPDMNTTYRAEFSGFASEAERVTYVIEQHLAALVAGDPVLGLAAGVTVDPSQFYLIGHSVGGFWSFQLATAWTNDRLPAPWQAIQGLVLIAPPVSSGLDVAPSIDLPLALILPECDGDVAMLDGQHHIEVARLDPERTHPTITYFLRGANHNFFNPAVAADDGERVFSRCLVETPRLARADQERFLANLTPTLFSAWAADAVDAIPGFALSESVPTSLYDVPLQIMPVRPAAQRRPLWIGSATGELSTNPLGGSVVVRTAELDFCPYGMAGNGNPCRAGVGNPGAPAQLHLAWESPDAQVELVIPPAFADATAASALQLRVAIDPLDRRSPAATEQRLRITLRDQNGAEAEQEISLAFPQGTIVRDEWFGHVFLGSVRLPLDAFDGIDLRQLVAIMLSPTTPSGAIFLADLELVASTTLSNPPQPSPYRSLVSSINAAELTELPEGSNLIVRLFRTDERGERRFVTIQSTSIAGTLPLSYNLGYHQAAIDERFDYLLDALLQLPDGRSFEAQPLPAITAGIPQPSIALMLETIIFVEPTPIPTDAALELRIRAPAGQPLPSGAIISVVLTQIDADGMGIETISVTSSMVGAQTVDSIVISVPYASSSIVAGATYGVSIDVFADDGFTRLLEPTDIIPVDLERGTAEIQL